MLHSLHQNLDKDNLSVALSIKSVSAQIRHTQKGYMATKRKHYNSWQVIIIKKGHPHIYKTFTSYSLATQYAGKSERAIAKGIFQDISEANQTKLKDVLVRYRDNVTVDKKGARQESYKINKLIRNKIANYSLVRITPLKIA